MSDNNHEHDDLTIIKGIGKNRAQWLRSSLDIQTLRDLSTMSATDIETRLKAEGFIISRAKIENWIEQARQILAEIAQENLLKTTVTSSQAEVDRSPASSSPAWKSLASFVVEYQTRKQSDGTEEKRTTIHHIESDQEMSWNMTTIAPLAEWMQAHLDAGADKQSGTLRQNQHQKVTNEAEALADEADTPIEAGEVIVAPAPVAPNTDTANQLEIIQIQAFQPVQTMRYAGGSRTGQPFLGNLKSEEAFALEASFKLNDEISKQIATSEAGFSVQFEAYDPQTGTVTRLGNTRTSKLQPDRKIQSAILPGAKLNKGLYRLRVFGTLHTETPATGYLEVPYFQVT